VKKIFKIISIFFALTALFILGVVSGMWLESGELDQLSDNLQQDVANSLISPEIRLTQCLNDLSDCTDENDAYKKNCGVELTSVDKHYK
jgi:hypothetical protein